MSWQSFWENSPRIRIFAGIMGLTGAVITPIIFAESLGLQCTNSPRPGAVIQEHMDHGRWAKAKELLLAVKNPGLDSETRQALLREYKSSMKDAGRFAKDIFRYRWWVSFAKDGFKSKTPYLYLYNTKALRFSKKKYRLKSDYLLQKKNGSGYVNEITFLKRLGRAHYRIFRHLPGGHRELAELKLKHAK